MSLLDRRARSQRHNPIDTRSCRPGRQVEEFRLPTSSIAGTSCRPDPGARPEEKLLDPGGAGNRQWHSARETRALRASAIAPGQYLGTAEMLNRVVPRLFAAILENLPME